jgi:type VI secretion system protein ImpF
MSDPTPLERLQPCLLDRLTDDDPANSQESRNQRMVLLPRYKRGVLRDLEWLFNCSAHLPEEGSEKFQIGLFPEAAASVINFGTRHLCGLVAPDMRELERQLAAAIQIFEPRIIRNTLSVKATIERHLISFEIRGDLWANPVPEHLLISTKIDLETGQASLGDRSDG